MTVDDVYLSFLPLAHILDRMIEEYFFHKGASVGYYQGVCSLLQFNFLYVQCVCVFRSHCLGFLLVLYFFEGYQCIKG